MRSLITCLAFVCPFFYAFSQELVGSDGNYSSDGNHSLSWSLGENVTSTEVNSPDILTQGFQQVDRSNIGLQELLGSDFSVYPVPFDTEITIEFNDPHEVYLISIFSSSGKLAHETADINAQNGILSIDLSFLQSGTYLLRLKTKNDQKTHYRRIVKT